MVRNRTGPARRPSARLRAPPFSALQQGPGRETPCEGGGEAEREEGVRSHHPTSAAISCRALRRGGRKSSPHLRRLHGPAGLKDPLRAAQAARSGGSLAKGPRFGGDSWGFGCGVRRISMRRARRNESGRGAGI